MRHPFVQAAVVALLAALIFIPFLGGCPLFDWDEINFAECAREMLVTGNYSEVQMHFRPFWEKPPFFIWMQAASMNIFGVNEFAARFPNALCSIFSLVSLFVIGRRIHSARMGYIWALLYASILLPHLYFRSGLIDPWFNLFIFLSIYQTIRLLNNDTSEKAHWWGLTGGLFLGLAVLTKGPSALGIVGLTLLAYAIWNRNPKILLNKGFLFFYASAIVVSGSWFLVEIARGNGHIVKEFIEYHRRLLETGDSGHDGPFFYHFVVLLIGCFPASILFITAYFRFRDITPYQRLMRRVMICLFWVVLIVFSIVKTKIVHYSSLCYFPLTFVVALALSQDSALRFRKTLATVYWIIAGLIFLAITAVTTFHWYSAAVIKSGIIADKFALQNLEANVTWNGFEWLLGILFLAASWLVYVAVKKEKHPLLFAGIALNLVFAWTAISVIIPKVELYSQHSAVAFYKSCVGKPYYIETHGFKSYAYVFYSERTPADYNAPEQTKFVNDLLKDLENRGFTRYSGYALARMHFMENGPIDRPAFVVIKTPQEEELITHENFKKLYQQNGFSFFMRMPDK
jgi:4-amino-4-deoxy-L-arabinose transferase-like glycosyltransferase